MKETKTCPKCQEEMEKGMIADGGGPQEEWGTKISTWGRSLENKHTVTTFRCKDCGFLESYAV